MAPNPQWTQMCIWKPLLVTIAVIAIRKDLSVMLVNSLRLSFLECHMRENVVGGLDQVSYGALSMGSGPLLLFP